MPGPALHLALADAVYARWAAAPVRAPFAPGPAARNAFLHGALGPDMGYFPGADPLLSTLAHHARTGDFCRALVAEARTDAGQAFAWGWVTHVLADVAIHPLVNEACGELLTGTRTPLWGEGVAREHLRVEMGLDAAYHARGRERRLEALGGAVFEEMAEAYRRTFGVAPATAALLDAHRRVTRLLPALGWWRSLAQRASPGGAGAAPAATALRLLAAACPRASHGRALFTPVTPSPWLRAEVAEIAAAFPDWFEAHLASELRFLRNHCLDTGEVTDGDPPCARDAISMLHRAWAGTAPALGRAA